MTVDPRIVAELRAMFLNGATPSRLIRHIADRHETDPEWPSRVDDYFDAAFRVVPFVRPLQGPHASSVDVESLDWSDLNGELLRNMVGRRASWKDEVEGPAWCDGLRVAPDDLKLIDGVQPEADPRLSDCWATLPTRAREAIRQAMVNAQGYFEQSQVLVRLVERLQQQVLEMERQPAASP